MNIGDLVLVRGIGIVSDIIEDIEHSSYSHSAGIVSDGTIIEAQGFQITNYVPLSKYKGMADIFTCDILTDKQREEIVEYVRKEVGSHYDWLLLLLEGIRYLFHIIIPYKEHKNRICSTLWNDAYKSVGVDLCPNIKYPSPADLSKSKLLRKVDSI